MKSVKVLKRVLALALCVAIATTDITVTNASGTENTEIVMSTETTEAVEGTEAKPAAETETTEVKETETTESTESTEVTETTEAAESTESTEATEATESTEVAETEATEVVEETEAVEETEVADIVNVIVEHLDTDGNKIYSNDVYELPAGTAVSNLAKADASEWQVEYVTVNGQTMAQANAEAMELTEDTLIDVYYSGIENEVFGDVNFYLYDTTANDEVGNPQPEYSINSDSNYTGTVGTQRFAVDAANQSKGAIAGLSEDYSKVLFNMDEPGVFPATRAEADAKCGLNLVDWYRMQLQKKGNTYTLGNIYGAENSVQAVMGVDFEPFADFESYFGMRYDVTFVLGEYEGTLDFTFTGNTNTWVILDGKTVVMDLGDAHDTVTESVDLWNYIGRAGYDKTETHRLTVLYMDRDPEKHACEMSFTLPNAGIVERQVGESYAEDMYGFDTMDVSFRVMAAEESVLNYSKTAKLTNWDERTYEIELKASSTATESSTTTTVPPVDVMMVFDLSGSMNGNSNGNSTELRAFKVIEESGPWWWGTTRAAKFSEVKNELNVSKIYYLNGTEKAEISTKFTEATIPVKYIDNEWKYYDRSNKEWKLVPGDKEIYTWDTRLSALKDAASSFVTGMSEKSPNSKIGISSFYGKKITSIWDTVGELNYSLDTISGNESNLLKSINSFYADGGTAPAKGLKYAKEQLEEAKDAGDKNSKYVILFTDGDPDVPTYDNGVETNEKEATENIAAELRTAGYTVITVGLGLTTDTSNWLSNKIASDKDKTAGTKWAYTASNTAELLNIFREISDTITSGVSLANVTITDVIDSRFEITDDEIQRLKDEESVTDVIRNNDGTTTIIWSEQTVEPAEGSDAGWNKKINVVAKEEYAGGNNVTTNVASGSKITYDGKEYPFQQPTVNVKIQFAISNATSNIFLGESLNGYADTAETEIKKVNGLTKDSEMLKDIDLSSLTLDYYSDEACTKKVTLADIKASKPEEDTKYYVKATVKPKNEATSSSNANSTIEVRDDKGKVISSIVYGNNVNEGVYATARKDKEGKEYAYAGQYDITVKTGELTITKKISKNAIKESEGDPIFTFKITNETTNEVYYKTLRFSLSSDEDNEDSAIEVGFINVKATTTLTGLPQGIYKVEELDTMGFTLESFKVTGGTCASKTDTDNIKIAMGLEEKEGSDWDDASTFSSVEGDGHLAKDKAVAKATNKKTRTPGKMTDTDVVKNSFIITEDGTGTVKKDPNVDNGNTSDVRK